MLFFGFHWSFTISEPSGKGWPLPGTPALYALIMVGLATITLSTSSVRAEETTAQSSYPLKSENAIPLGDFSEYLSCAETAVATRAASAAVAIAIVSLLLRFVADPYLNQDFHFGSWIGHSISHPQSLILRSAVFSPGAFFCRCQAPNSTHWKTENRELLFYKPTMPPLCVWT